MAALDQVFKKHLFTPDYEAIHGQFQDDPSDLIREEGVNYEYEGKIWNVRILQVCDESQVVKEIFLRIHSNRQIYLYKFSAKSETSIYRTHAELGGLGSGDLVKTADLDHLFKKVIAHGVRNDVAEVPKLPRKVLESSFIAPSCKIARNSLLPILIHLPNLNKIIIPSPVVLQ